MLHFVGNIERLSKLPRVFVASFHWWRYAKVARVKGEAFRLGLYVRKRDSARTRIHLSLGKEQDRSKVAWGNPCRVCTVADLDTPLRMSGGWRTCLHARDLSLWWCKDSALGWSKDSSMTEMGGADIA